MFMVGDYVRFLYGTPFVLNGGFNTTDVYEVVGITITSGIVNIKTTIGAGPHSVYGPIPISDLVLAAAPTTPAYIPVPIQTPQAAFKVGDFVKYAPPAVGWGFTYEVISVDIISGTVTIRACSIAGQPLILTYVGIKDLILTSAPTQLTLNTTPVPEESSNLLFGIRPRDLFGGPKCECGSEAVGSPRHSDWCPKH